MSIARGRRTAVGQVRYLMSTVAYPKLSIIRADNIAIKNTEVINLIHQTSDVIGNMCPVSTVKKVIRTMNGVSITTKKQ